MLSFARSFADTFIVTNNSNAGLNSLNEKIDSANANSVADTILFDLDVKVLGYGRIDISTGLSDVSSQIHFIGNEQVEFNGGGVQSGMFFKSGSNNSSVEGFVFRGFIGYALTFNESDSCKIETCYFGITPTLDLSEDNGGGINLINSSKITIGGSNSKECEITNSTSHGVLIEGANSIGNIVSSNFIGVTGNGNNGSGVVIQNEANSNIISNNVISGNGLNGVELAQSGTNNNIIKSNIIGLIENGASIKSNGQYGVLITNGADNNQIGGSLVDDKNIISGNVADGILIDRSDNQIVFGNYIGVDQLGNSSLGNSGNGIRVDNSNNSTISNNQISGNGIHGVHFQSSVRNALVTNNIIGGDNSGVLAIPNSENGILIEGNSGNTARNRIGDGTKIGENTIVHNGKHGIQIVGFSRLNDINRNSIHSNTGLGIELEDDLVVGDDFDDSDDGANTLQNKPILQNLSVQGALITYEVTHFGVNSGYVRFDYYASTNGDISGYGEGQFFVGSDSLEVTSGLTFSRSFIVPIESRSFSVLATQNFNTSEFSNAESAVPGAGSTPPEANNDDVIALEDSTTIIYVTNNDTDIDGDLDSLSFMILDPQPQNGTAGKISNTGSISYTPDPEFNGLDTIVYKVCDKSIPTPLCSEAKVFIEVVFQPDPPTAFNETYSIKQGSDTIVNVLINDTDIDNDLDSSSIKIIYQSNINATYSIVSNHLYIDYRGIPSYALDDTLRYLVCDSTSPVPLCDTAEVIINVSQGAIPDFSSIKDTILEDSGGKSYDLMNYVSDSDNEIVSDSLSIIASPLNGEVDLTNAGILTYTPDSNYYGTESIGIRVCDVTGNCNTGTIIIDVENVPDYPIAVNDTATRYQAGDAFVYLGGNDVDVDGDIDLSTVNILNSSSSITYILNKAKDGEVQINYSSDIFFTGIDTIEYEICDLSGLCDTAFAYVTIVPGNPPVTNPDSITVNEDSSGVIIYVLDNDTDTDDNIVDSTFKILKQFTSSAAYFEVSSKGLNVTLGKNFNGKDTLVYQICDFLGACASDSVFINVLPQTDLLILEEINLTLTQTKCDGFVLVSLFDSISIPDLNQVIDSNSFVIYQSLITGKTFNSNSDGLFTVTYNDLPLFSGVDSLKYELCDNKGACDSNYIIIDVLKTSLPQLLEDTITIKEKSDTLINVLLNDSNVDVDSITIVKPFSSGLYELNKGEITIKFSGTDYFGYDTLEYEVCNSNCYCASTNLIVYVEKTQVDTSEIVLNDDVFIFKEGCVTDSINLFENDNLPSNIYYESLKFVEPLDFHWNLKKSGFLVVSFPVDTISQKSLSVNYTICDSLGFCDTANIMISVINNEGPELESYNIEFEEGDEFIVEISPLLNVFDEDGVDSGTLEISKKTNHGTNFINQSLKEININLEGVVDYSIKDTLVFSVCDNYCICNSDSVFLSFLELENILIYEGISPNGDGYNDKWEITNIEKYPLNEIKIYNRWGNLVFKTKAYDNVTNFWEGKSTEGIMLDNEVLPSGVYYFVIDLGDGSDVFKGQIVLQH